MAPQGYYRELSATHSANVAGYSFLIEGGSLCTGK
jgi:hypothetical protein